MSEISIEQSNKKKGLGRGLGSLLGGGAHNQADSTGASTTPAVSIQNTQQALQKPVAPAAPATQSAPVDPESKIWKVAIEKLSPGEYQPRQVFDKAPLQELSQSIKENGILQPIVARRTVAGKLEIVAGERRWRAAQLAGLTEVPVILKNFDDRQALELAIIENIQREDLNAIDEAEGYQRLISEFGMTQQQVADRVGKDRATVANSVRILTLPSEVKTMIASSELSLGHAKVLLSVADAKRQVELAKKVVTEKLAVRKLEKLIQASASSSASGAKEHGELGPAVTQRLIAGLSEELQKMLGTKVNIDYSNSKGKISVYFYSDDELTQIIDKLREGCQK